jgi:DNA repair exonuclease SbcCD ATPase subunit
MELLGVMLAVAMAGSGYALGRRDGRTLGRAELERRLDEQESRLALLAKEVAGLPAYSKRISSLEQDARALDQQLKAHMTALAQDTLALGTELKGSLAALESGVDARLNSLDERQGEVVQALDQQLQGMQSFIVQAAEDAKARREAITAAAPVNGSAAPTAEMASLLEQQRQAQAVFAARRRAAAEAGFPGPGGGARGGSL